MDPAQMKFLRLLSMHITQTVTHHCYNFRAGVEEDDRTIKLQWDNEMELTSSEKTDNCGVSRNSGSGCIKHLQISGTFFVPSKTAKKSSVLVETAIFYGPLKCGLFSARVNWRPGLVTSFQANHRVAQILSRLLRSVVLVLFIDEKNK